MPDTVILFFYNNMLDLYWICKNLTATVKIVADVIYKREIHIYTSRVIYEILLLFQHFYMLSMTLFQHMLHYWR